MLRNENGGLVTRIGAEVGAALTQEFPQGEYHPAARTFRIKADDLGPKLGKVVVVTAGTSDLPVAEEARITAETWNCEVSLIADVGVAGIHRLFRRLPEFEGADAMVVVAGMEGALPSVVGGLVDCPVIAVPPASATAPASAAWRPCSGCSTVARRTSSSSTSTPGSAAATSPA